MTATPPANPAPAIPDLYDTLREFVGLDAGPPRQAPDPVNQPMIRHFVEAMGDGNPIYVDDEAAREAGRDGVVAPAPMLSTWLMLGYRERQNPARADGTEAAAGTPLARLLGLLTAGGFTGVVATNDEQTYHRELRPGDRLSMSAVIEDVSPRKQTALGPGHFVTTLRTYCDAGGTVVAEQRFRILRFAPKQAADAGEAGVSARPRPFVLPDSEFWFAAAREHRLVIQACEACGRLRHPPSPMCPHCLCPGWHEVAASGRGTVHSYVITHHPRAPGFEYPLVVILADLEEGTRLVAGFAGDPGSVQIGMPVEVEWVRLDDEFTLPRFRAAGEA